MDRINKYRAAVYFLQLNRQDCSLFYELNTRLLKQCEAQFLPFIVGPEFVLEPDSFYQLIDQNPVPNLTFTLSGRNTGKSTTLAMAVAALLCVLDAKLVITLVGDYGTKLLMLIQRFFIQLPDRPNILKMTLSTLIIENMAKITLKLDDSTNIIIIDEDEHLENADWLLLEDKRCVICVSSPVEASSSGKIKAALPGNLLDYSGNAPWVDD